MSPRAAWRLEALGFPTVYDYAGGKQDWAAAGLQTEGKTVVNRAVDLARRDAPTCRPDETLADARARVAASGLDICVVTNDNEIVIGALRTKELQGPDDVRVEDAMMRGPSTFRPNVPIAEMAEYMTKNDLPSAPITSSDGRLIGVLFRDDAVRRARETGG